MNMIIKKILAFVSVIFTLFLYSFTFGNKFHTQAQTQADFYPEGYVINNFSALITINKDRSISIAETIDVNFTQYRHGIYRIIPNIYSYKGKTINSRLKILSVTDENAVSYPYSTSRLNQSISIKIGDADKTIIGKKTFIITYLVRNILLDYDNSPELYLNITGSQWDTQILKSSATVISEYADIVESQCFAGVAQTNEKECTSNFGKSNAVFFSTSPLGVNKDFTIVVGLAKENNLIQPNFLQKIIIFITDNWGYLPALVPALLMAYFWNKKGRDEKYMGDNYYYKPDKEVTKKAPIFARGHIPMVYAPINNLTPAQIGTILDEKVDINDIIAEMVELARLGYIKIIKLPKTNVFAKQDYVFEKQKQSDDKLKNYQQEILKELFRSTVVADTIGKLDKLFEKECSKKDQAIKGLLRGEYVSLSSLKNHFYTALPVIKKKLYEGLKEEKIFYTNPEETRAGWVGISILLSIISGIIISFFASITYNMVPFFLLIPSAIASLAFGLKMPKKTAWGYSLYKQILGLRQYLKLSKWRNEHYEKKLFFEEIIPLAISLGVVKNLSSDMAELGINPPSYFYGFTTARFAGDLLGFQNYSASSFISSPQSSGHSSWSGGSGFSGGSSGGGFGGGGGGSW